MLTLFDTHTHFDVEDFDEDRQLLAEQAFVAGVSGLILIGFLAKRFPNLLKTHQQLLQWNSVPKSYLAPGLHPFYIEDHNSSDLVDLEEFLKENECVAIGEIGLDFFEKRHKPDEIKALQAHFFSSQLELAKAYDKPVLLHIRKAHGETLKILKQHQFKNGGIAHAFSGGVEEAKAFVRLGFKIGVTGQITNPNSKRLHDVVKHIGIDNLVIETDCPDMTPLCCQQSTEYRTRNTPANLVYVLERISEVLNLDKLLLAERLWLNSLEALKLDSAMSK